MPEAPCCWVESQRLGSAVWREQFLDQPDDPSVRRDKAEAGSAPSSDQLLGEARATDRRGSHRDPARLLGLPQEVNWTLSRDTAQSSDPRLIELAKQRLDLG